MSDTAFLIVAIVFIFISVPISFYQGMKFERKRNLEDAAIPDFDENNPINERYKQENIDGHIFYRITPEGQWQQHDGPEHKINIVTNYYKPEKICISQQFSGEIDNLEVYVKKYLVSNLTNELLNKDYIKFSKDELSNIINAELWVVKNDKC